MSRTLDAFKQADPAGRSREVLSAARVRAKVLKQARGLLEQRIAKIDAELADLQRRASEAATKRF